MNQIEDIQITNVEEPIKRKKGRPRKEIQNVEVEKQPEEKKKRGRKKKEGVVEEVKQKKKRGRKAAVKYFSSSIRKKIPLTTVLQDTDNFILHLDIKEEANQETSNQEEFQQESIDKNQLTNQDILPLFDKIEIIDTVLKQIKHENKINESELQKEYDDLLENQDTILNQVLDEDNANEDNVNEDNVIEDNVNEYNANKDNVNKDNANKYNVNDLYEKRVEFREEQDTLLVNRLENIHKKNDVYDKIIHDNLNIKLDKDEYKDNNKKKGYFEIMYEFIHNTDWLHNTDICCWWCCHNFETIPIGIPIYFNGVLQKFNVKGVFCSFSCVMAYNKDKKLNKDYLIKYLYRKLTGTLTLDATLIPAPPRCSLKMFGGELTIEQFRNGFKENKVYKMIEYPMFISKDYIEEVDIQNLKKVNQKVFSDTSLYKSQNLDEKRIQDAKSRLLQIEKSTVTIGNTIDKFIKIT